MTMKTENTITRERQRSKKKIVLEEKFICLTFVAGFLLGHQSAPNNKSETYET